MFKPVPLVFFSLLPFGPLMHAAVVEYSIDIAEQEISPAGEAVKALTLNGGIPGPVLRFKEGDTARITVNNRLKGEEVSIHWHGVLVPNVEDGVPRLTTPPINGGESRTFEFPIKQSGTYWYHSHTGLQEQRGVYGAIVIEPKAGETVKTDREEVLVLSDWTNEDPNEVMRTLMRGSDWYAIRKGTAQSLFGAIRAGHLMDFLNREKSRLPPMDVSDVAYDVFLINGKRSAKIAGKPGETIRLRVINASAATYFYLSSSTGPLQIVANDGIDVSPIHQKLLLVGAAETYDIVVKVPESGSWEFRATAQDNSGHASVFLGEGSEHAAPAPGPLDPYNMNAALAAVLDQLDDTGELTDDEALAAEPPRPLPPYKRLKATRKTTLPANAPVREITMKLDGDMMRYLWSIDGKTIQEDSTIVIKRGEVIRLQLVNNTMMHHPMHLHGHFFRLLMPDSVDPDFAPLKHTVDVPPMSRRTIEFYAGEEKDWLFHCHILYHHMTGMARVFSYEGEVTENPPATGATPANATGRAGKGIEYSAPESESEPTTRKVGVAPASPGYSGSGGSSEGRATRGIARVLSGNSPGDRHEPDIDRDSLDPYFFMLDGNIQSQMSMGMATLMNGRNNFNVMWEAGWQNVEEPEYETDFTYQRYFNPRWTAFGGYRLTNMMGSRNAAIAGTTYKLPYMVDATLTVKSDVAARFALSKTLQLTDRLAAFVRVQYDTTQDFDYLGGLTYTLSKNFSLIISYDSNFEAGAGVVFRF